MNYILESSHEQGMNVGGVDSIVSLLILASSSETSTLALVSGTCFALKTPSVMQRMRRETQDSKCDIPRTSQSQICSIFHKSTQSCMKLCDCTLQFPSEAYNVTTELDLAKLSQRTKRAYRQPMLLPLREP